MKAVSRSSGYHFSAALALGVAACLWPLPARGDDAAELAGLLAEPVVSVASKSAERASDAPATTSVLTAADLRRYGIRSLAEAIDFLGMGLVTQDPLHSVEIGSRGVLISGDYGAHVLVLVDGHALNEPWNGTAYVEQGLGVPLELIDHVELVLGPGSVLYGGNAMLGVINVVTKKVNTYRGLTLVAEGGLSPEHGRGGRLTSFMPGDLGTTHRLGVGIGKSFRLFGEDASFVGSAELYGQSGPSFEFPIQTGNTSVTGAPYDYGPRAPAPGAWGGRVHEQYYTSVPTVWAKLSIGDLTLSARATQYDRATPYINYFNQLTSDFDERRSFESERWLSLDARYHKHVGERLELVTHAYADSYRYEQLAYNSETTQCAPATPPCFIAPRVLSRWAGVELQATIDWLHDDSLTTLVGADVRVRDVRAHIDVDVPNDGPTVASSTLGNATEVPWAVYVQQRYSPVKRAHLNAGARFDSDPRGGERISPRAAFAVDPWSGGVVKGIYAEAFRAPSYFESVYRPSSDASNDQLGGITQLRPETVRGVEASLEQRLGGQRISMGVYRTWWRDMISLSIVDQATGSLAYQNGSTITNYGFNGRFEGTSGDWAYGASVTGGYARRNADGYSVKLPVAPHLFGNARASYDLPGSWPVLALAASFVSSRLADRANDGGFARVPVAPLSLTLRATVSGEVGLLEGLGYRLAFNYVTAASSPYVAGPVQQGDPTDPDGPLPSLAPVNRLLGFATLTYNLPL